MESVISNMNHLVKQGVQFDILRRVIVIRKNNCSGMNGIVSIIIFERSISPSMRGTACLKGDVGKFVVPVHLVELFVILLNPSNCN
jgi:hypothetical protein